MKKIFLGLVFTIFVQFSYGQNVDSIRILPKNSVYVELLGNAFVGSVNYERLFYQKNKWRIGGRVGLMYFPSYISQNYTNAGFFIPTELIFLRGKNRHFLEMSLGITMYQNISNKEKPITVSNSDNPSFLNLRIGYRYQNPNGLMLRIGAMGITTYPNRNSFSTPWLGISLGYSF